MDTQIINDNQQITDKTIYIPVEYIHSIIVILILLTISFGLGLIICFVQNVKILYQISLIICILICILSIILSYYIRKEYFEYFKDEIQLSKQLLAQHINLLETIVFILNNKTEWTLEKLKYSVSEYYKIANHVQRKYFDKFGFIFKKQLNQYINLINLFETHPSKLQIKQHIVNLFYCKFLSNQEITSELIPFILLFFDECITAILNISNTEIRNKLINIIQLENEYNSIINFYSKQSNSFITEELINTIYQKYFFSYKKLDLIELVHGIKYFSEELLQFIPESKRFEFYKQQMKYKISYFLYLSSFIREKISNQTLKLKDYKLLLSVQYFDIIPEDFVYLNYSKRHEQKQIITYHNRSICNNVLVYI